MKGFDKVGESMLAEWVKRAGPDGQKVIDSFRASK
jgi:hypothetical protein